jgi:hypothetical protein
MGVMKAPHSVEGRFCLLVEWTMYPASGGNSVSHWDSTYSRRKLYSNE